jgi:hypothetical protein
MDTVGGEISGYCATGRLISEIIPTSTSTIEMTMAVTGLFIKVSAIMGQVNGDQKNPVCLIFHNATTLRLRANPALLSS